MSFLSKNILVEINATTEFAVAAIFSDEISAEIIPHTFIAP
jgi:hypothetical protein